MDGPIQFLRGERLYLRPIDEEDLYSCQRWMNDPEIRRTIGVVWPTDAEGERRWWEDQDRRPPPQSMQFTIALNETDEQIGITGFTHIDWLNRRAETSSVIGDAPNRGKGYGTEAKGLLLDYAFDTLGMHRIDSRTYSYNEASARHLLRHGFVEEGRRREGVFREGEFHDVVLFGLLASEWRSRRDG